MVLPLSVALECSTPGQAADDSVAAALRDSRVADWAADSTVRQALRGYGAWDDLDTASRETLRTRALWVAACAIREQPADYMPWGQCADGGCLCPECRRDELSRLTDVDPECPDDRQWLIVGEDWDGEGQCSHCDKTHKDMRGQ